MGYFILAANISLWVGLLGTATSLGNNSDLTSWPAFWIAIVINVATIIRLWIEKRKYKGTKFSTSQMAYFISIACIAVGVLHFTLNGRNSSLLMLIPLLGGVFVAIFACLIIGAEYLALRNQKGAYEGKEHIFKPADYNRRAVASTALRKILIGMGSLAIVVAVILFLVGGWDSLDNGDWEKRTCAWCGGSGRVSSGESCPKCDGFGGFLGKGSTANYAVSPALWIGGVGIAMIVIGSRFKDDSVANDTKVDQANKKDKTTEIWYCPNCSTPNSTLLRDRCKKCGQPRP